MHQQVTILLQHGANAKICNQSNNSPANLAVTNNSLSILRLLINNDHLVISHTDGNNDGLLHYAAFNPRNLKVLNYLLSLPININAQNLLGETALHVAALGSNKPGIKMLLAHGANKAISDKKGNFPIYHAQYPEIEQLLQVSSIEKFTAKLLQLFFQ